MANPLKCDLCSKPATVHLTQIINSKVHKVDLCEACAQAKGVTDPQGFSLADLLLKATTELDQPSVAGGQCPECGFTQPDFKKHGRFGCPTCYKTFSGVLEPLLGNMHKGSIHTGKVPKKSLERKHLLERISSLEAQLESAIKSELYEDAARLRDEITEVKQASEQKLAR